MQRNESLTVKQKKVFDFVLHFCRERGFSPSLKDIAQFIETTNLSTAQYYVEQLVIKGYLQKNANKNRGIIPASATRLIQLLGYISAGFPIEPVEDSQTISVPQDMIMSEAYSHYALRVRGDSMMDMGILDGDIVIIRHQLTADNGDVVVAITEAGATLKTLRVMNNSIYLEPKNKTFPNIYPEHLEIRGKLVGLVRS